MTNEERVLNAHGRSQSSRPETTGPWAHARELRRFWAIARKAGVSKDGVHAIIEGHYPGKRRLHDLTRVEFIKVMDLLFHGPSSPSDTIPDLDIRHGACADGQWRKIRWLQRQLRWSDTHHFHVTHGSLHCRRIDRTRDHPGCRIVWSSAFRLFHIASRT